MKLPTNCLNQPNLLTDQNQQAVTDCLQEIQAVLENIQPTRKETEQLRAAAEPLLDQLLNDSAQRIVARQNEINQLKAEAEILQARLANT